MLIIKSIGKETILICSSEPAIIINNDIKINKACVGTSRSIPSKKFKVFITYIIKKDIKNTSKDSLLIKYVTKAIDSKICTIRRIICVILKISSSAPIKVMTLKRIKNITELLFISIKNNSEITRGRNKAIPPEVVITSLCAPLDVGIAMTSFDLIRI
jgi:hypothetical protein